MKKKTGFSVVLFFALIPMLYHADYVTEGAKYGLLLWYQSVVPALFPFMVISGLIVSGGGIPVIMAPVHRLLRLFLPITSEGCYALVAGLLCGYPMGAKTCADFIREGRISPDEGRFLMAVCNHPSPMFLLGYVYPFFAEAVSVKTLLISVYAPIVILAFGSKCFYFRKCFSKTTCESNETPCSTNKNKNTFFESSTQTSDETILSAVTILCKIGGYLMLFSILIVFLRHMPFIPEGIRLFLIGAMEMTTGIRELSASLAPTHGFVASVAALTFGGCSGIFQTKAVLGNTKKAGLSIRPYIIWKLLHTLISSGIAYFLCTI